MFEKFIKWLAREQISTAYKLGILNEQERRYNEIKNTDWLISRSLIGKFVIYTSNEWEDPVIGLVTRVDGITLANSPALIINDIISGEERMVLSSHVYDYAPETLDAILKLDPYQRWNLKSFYSQVTYDKPKHCNKLLTPEEVKQKVRDYLYPPDFEY